MVKAFFICFLEHLILTQHIRPSVANKAYNIYAKLYGVSKLAHFFPQNLRPVFITQYKILFTYTNTITHILCAEISQESFKF